MPLSVLAQADERTAGTDETRLGHEQSGDRECDVKAPNIPVIERNSATGRIPRRPVP